MSDAFRFETFVTSIVISLRNIWLCHRKVGKEK